MSEELSEYKTKVATGCVEALIQKVKLHLRRKGSLSKMIDVGYLEQLVEAVEKLKPENDALKKVCSNIRLQAVEQDVALNSGDNIEPIALTPDDWDAMNSHAQVDPTRNRVAADCVAWMEHSNKEIIAERDELRYQTDLWDWFAHHRHDLQCGFDTAPFWDVVDRFTRYSIGSGPTPIAAIRAAKEKG